VRVVKIMAGFALLLAGIAMLALPGPGWVTIAAGLALLAAEYHWARKALDQLKRFAAASRDAWARRGAKAEKNDES
jgi:uncharacterized protein (TIGR02611 family)